MPFQYDRNNLGWGQDALKELFGKQSSLRKWLESDQKTYQQMLGRSLERELSFHSREEAEAWARKVLKGVDTTALVGSVAAILVCYGLAEQDAKKVALQASDVLNSVSEAANFVGKVWNKLSGQPKHSDAPAEKVIRKSRESLRDDARRRYEK
jgi:hypothetical protein